MREAVKLLFAQIADQAGIGEALEGSFDGELDFKYDEDGYFLRVDWRRDD